MLYLSMTKLTPDAAKALLAEGFAQRAADVAKSLEAAGGRYVGLYVADGAEWDWIAIVEFPDTWTTATVTRSVFQGMAQGAYQKYKILALSTPESLDAAQPAVTFRSLLDE
jgi:uncharacterized protein with GYD domain